MSLGCVLLVTVGVLAPGATVYRPVPFRQAEFDDAVAWVVAHRTQSSDVMPLPEAFRGLSRTGKVYLTGGDIPQVTINVPTRNGAVNPSAMLVPDGALTGHWYFVCDPADVPV